MANNTVRCALYCRVSTEDQKRHGLSLPEQEHSLEEYAKEHNMKVVGKYIDAGISARKRYTKRPELLRLLDDVKANKIDTILFIKLDRWFRDVSGYYDVQKILDQYHVSWRATQEDYETVTASGRFKVNIMLSVAQDEADRTSERIKFVFDGKRERNEPINGNVPPGYKIEGKTVVIDPETAPLVRKAWNIYLETGMPSKAIDGVPELNLNYHKARRMFSSRAYLGECQGIKIPPLVTQEEFDRAEQIHGHAVRKTKNHTVYLFSGLMTCPECGCRMGSRANFIDGKVYIYYICGSYNSRRGCTYNVWHKETKIESYLLEHIDGKVKTIMSTKEKTEEISYKPQRDAVVKKLSKLSDLYINDLIDINDYKKRYTELNAELETIPKDKPKADHDRLTKTFFPNWQDIYNDLSREEKRIFWRNTIASIQLSGKSVVDFTLR